MGWDIRQVDVERPGSPASIFSFELHVPRAQAGERILAGDGVVLTRLGKVIVNRQRELELSLDRAGLDSGQALDDLRSRVLRLASSPAAARA